MIEKALSRQIKVILLTPTGDIGASLDDPNDPLNQHAEQIRSLARHYQVGLADSLAATKGYIHDGGRLEELMSQQNHPNRRGHDLVVRELLEWFPEGD
jgi:lysophospholipase L1-like esterase